MDNGYIIILDYFSETTYIHRITDDEIDITGDCIVEKVFEKLKLREVDCAYMISSTCDIKIV